LKSNVRQISGPKVTFVKSK